MGFNRTTSMSSHSTGNTSENMPFVRKYENATDSIFTNSPMRNTSLITSENISDSTSTESNDFVNSFLPGISKNETHFLITNIHDHPQAYFTNHTIDKVALVYYPIIIPIGIIGNICALFLLNRKWIRDLSVSFFLSALAYSDIGFLLCFFTFRWLTNSVIPLDLADLYSAACKAALYMNSIFIQTSSLLVVAVTYDRFFTVYFPLKAKTHCTKKRAKIVTSCIVIVVFGLFSWFLWGWHSSGGECTLMPNFHDVFTNALLYIHIALFPIIPCICLIVLNTLILVKTTRSMRRRGSKLGVSARGRANNTTKKVTVLVLVTSVTYLALTLPFGLMYIMSMNVSSHEDTWDVEDQTKYTLRILADFLLLINSSINFFLYILSGEKFRKEAILMFRDCMYCCKKRYEKNESVRISEARSKLPKKAVAPSVKTIELDTSSEYLSEEKVGNPLALKYEKSNGNETALP